jgi:putative hydrolase of the HAD superfamily
VTYRAVFFDAGETLVHPHPSFPELMVAILRREGYEIGPDDVHVNATFVADHFKRAAEENLLWTTSPDKSKAFWLGVYRTFLDHLGIPDTDGLPERLYAEFTDLANYRVFPDVLPVLRRLRDANLKLGVISNFEQWLGRLLARLGIAGLLDVQVISGVEGVEKPDPAIFRLALDRTGLRPDQCVYVGDNPVFDTTPAEALGMKGVLIDRRERYPDYQGPGVRITAMTELPPILRIATGEPAPATRAER